METPPTSSSRATFRTLPPDRSGCDRSGLMNIVLIGTIASSRNPAIPEMPFLINTPHSQAIPMPENRMPDISGTADIDCRGASNGPLRCENSFCGAARLLEERVSVHTSKSNIRSLSFFRAQG